MRARPDKVETTVHAALDRLAGSADALGIALSGGLFETGDGGGGTEVTATEALQDGSARASNYALPDGALALSASRSAERRAGNECRSRGSPYH